MFSFLNRFGLPLKYAILCGAGALVGTAIAGLILPDYAPQYLSVLIGGTAGGAIAGWYRQRKGMTG